MDYLFIKHPLGLEQASEGVLRRVFTKSRIFSFGKGKRVLEKLQSKLKELGYPVLVEKDDTEGDMSEIASRNYDFIICIPGLQKKIF